MLGSFFAEQSANQRRQEMPLHFMSRLDGKEHYGQLIRNVGTSARRKSLSRSVWILIRFRREKHGGEASITFFEHVINAES